MCLDVLKVKMCLNLFSVSILLLSSKVLLINGRNEELCKLESYFDIDKSLNGLEQDDPVLIEAIKRKLISPPSSNAPYNFTRYK